MKPICDSEIRSPGGFHGYATLNTHRVIFYLFLAALIGLLLLKSRPEANKIFVGTHRAYVQYSYDSSIDCIFGESYGTYFVSSSGNVSGGGNPANCPIEFEDVAPATLIEVPNPGSQSFISYLSKRNGEKIYIDRSLIYHNGKYYVAQGIDFEFTVAQACGMNPSESRPNWQAYTPRVWKH